MLDCDNHAQDVVMLLCHHQWWSTDVHSAHLGRAASKQASKWFLCVSLTATNLASLSHFISSNPVISKDTPSTGLNGTGCMKVGG